MQSLWHDTHRVPARGSDEFIPGADYDTIIAGAGITGLTAAVLLARAGHRVTVLEARSVGAAATGNTTAKLSLLQGTTLTGISDHQTASVLRAYVEGNLEAQSWLLQYLDAQGVKYQRRTAYTYAVTEAGAHTLRQELRASESAGLPVHWTDETELPFEVTGALALDDQAQFHPLEVLGALAAELRDLDGTLIEGVRLTGAGTGSPLDVRTSHGTVQAKHLVLATGAPVLDRGGYFAKLRPSRSYALAYRVPGSPGSIPQGMYLSADQPSRSLRTAPREGEELLLVGGNGHVVGRAESPQAAVDDLDTWTREHFPGAERTHAWAAQDYRSANHIPFIGTLPRGGGSIYVATGYNKWGMTNGVAAARAIAAEILGEDLPWAQTLGHRITTPSDLVTGLRDGISVGREMASGWAAAQLHALPGEPPAEGAGRVGRSGGKPVAVATVDGSTCRLSAVCTHMGGVLRWNDAELSWDCPLHGSRFAPDGSVLEGPAVKDLPRL